MTPDWSPLRDLLAQFRTAGLPLPVWWRDDDAIEPTAALDRLHSLAETLAFETHLAVIPGLARPGLAQVTGSTPYLTPLVHGLYHHNHAPVDQKKSEFGTLRDGAIDEISAGVEHMRRVFGTAFVPVFVPPWNRLAPDYIAALPKAGLRGLSTFTPRTACCPVPGLVQINTHIDPIDWKGTRDLKDPDQIIAESCARLAARLSGAEDAKEPLGYLTHHLVHTEQVWDFSERFLSTLRDGGATVQPIAPLLETDP